MLVHSSKGYPQIMASKKMLAIHVCLVGCLLGWYLNDLDNVHGKKLRIENNTIRSKTNKKEWSISSHIFEILCPSICLSCLFVWQLSKGLTSNFEQVNMFVYLRISSQTRRNFKTTNKFILLQTNTDLNEYCLFALEKRKSYPNSFFNSHTKRQIVVKI